MLQTAVDLVLSKISAAWIINCFHHGKHGMQIIVQKDTAKLFSLSTLLVCIELDKPQRLLIYLARLIRPFNKL